MFNEADLKRCQGWSESSPHMAPRSEFASFHKQDRSRLQKRCRNCHSAWMKVYRQRLKARPAEEVLFAQRAGVKRCHRCASMGRDPIRPFDDFHKGSDTPDGKRNHCKDCVRELRWQHYGIVGMTVERFQVMLELQNFRCAIPSCGVTATEIRTLDVDHCHDSGEVRGLLCKSCNVVLSKTRSVAVLRDLISYVERAGSRLGAD